MARLIDADKLWKHKFKSASEKRDLDVVYMSGWNDAIDSIVENTPTVDAEPIRHGRWISESQQRVFKCSACGHYLDFDGVNAGRGSANYCPNCGAKMDEETEDELDK